MKKVLFPIVLSLLVGGPALAAHPTDTLTILRYRALPVTKLTAPMETDSVNLYGKSRDSFTSLTDLPIVAPDSPLLTDFTAPADTVIRLEGGRLYRLSTAILSTSYEKASLMVSCTMPYKLYFDGKVLGEKNRVQADPQEDHYDLTVYPSARRTLSIAIEARDSARLVMSVVPERSGHTLSLSTDPVEYMSMDFGLTGETLTGVRMSPSGRFTVLSSVRIVNLKRLYSSTLYEGTHRIGTLPDGATSGSWMPRSDRLYYTVQTDLGRSLMTYDPATGAEELLCEAIPEGSFTMAPSEDRLIFYRETIGDKHSTYVDRALGRDDHRGLMGPRTRYDLYLFDFATRDYRPLTYGYRSVGLEDISPDSRRIIFSVTDEDVTESPFYATAYYEMDLETMAIDTLFAPTPDLSYVGYTHAPGQLLVLGNPDAFGGLGRNLPDGMTTNTYETDIYLYDRRSKAAKVFTKDFAPSVQSVRLAQDRMQAVFRAADRDYQRLYTLDLTSGKISPLPVSVDYVGSYAVDARCKTFAYVGESANRVANAYLEDVTRRTSSVLRDLASERMKDMKVGSVQDWSFTMPDGGQVPGRFYLPPTFDPQKEYPLLVYYYGGTSPVGRMFDWYYSQPMYAAQDYVVLVLNPSGTIGWGQEYAARHVNAWGDRTADEIIAATKGFVDTHPYVNGKRIGCFGASYGGFMTQYLLTKTDLFACAISHAGISALSSYWGQGTWGIGYSTVASTDSYPWNNPDLYAKHSPLFRADKIHTPLLLTHGTSDTNVPFGESVQLYNALKILGRPVEMIRVYGEDHHVMELHRRQIWMRSMMAWFQKWLKDDPTWWDDMYPERHY